MTDTDTDIGIDIATAVAITKRLVIGPQQWGIADENALELANKIKEAMLNGTSAELAVLDPHGGHSVTVFLNGAAAVSVEVDLLKGPRPSEMSKSGKPSKP